MSKDTPGPFYQTPSLTIVWGDRSHNQYVELPIEDRTEADQEALCDLLNKGTHFGRMLDALKDLTGAYSTIPAEIGGPAQWQDNMGLAMSHARATIAEAEGMDDG